MVTVDCLERKKKGDSVRSGIRTHAYNCRLRPERSALDRSAILTCSVVVSFSHSFPFYLLPFLSPSLPPSLPPDPAQPKSEWTLSEGWVAEEGKDLLPPKTVGRTNLIDCYQALLLAALMEAGLFEVSIK